MILGVDRRRLGKLRGGWLDGMGVCEDVEVCVHDVDVYTIL